MRRMMMWASILNAESQQVCFICALSQQSLSFVLDHLGRNLVGMVDELYDCRIRRQLHDDAFVLLLGD